MRLNGTLDAQLGAVSWAQLCYSHQLCLMVMAVQACWVNSTVSGADFNGLDTSYISCPALRLGCAFAELREAPACASARGVADIGRRLASDPRPAQPAEASAPLPFSRFGWAAGWLGAAG